MFTPRVIYEILAQMVEHNTFNIGVIGSSPICFTSEEHQCAMWLNVAHETLVAH